MEISRTNSLGTSEQVLTTERVWRFSVLALAAVGTLHVLKLGGCCWRERHGVELQGAMYEADCSYQGQLPQ